MFKAMKDSVLSCLFGGFSGHSQCGQEATVPRDRSPHQRQPTAAMDWNVGQESNRRGPTKKLSRGSSPRKPETIPLMVSTSQPQKQRPQYLLDLKSDTPYLESDLVISRSRTPASDVSHQQQPHVLRAEADVHQSYHDNHHYDDLPVRGILKKKPHSYMISPSSVSRTTYENARSPESPIYLSLQSRSGATSHDPQAADKPIRPGELSQESIDFWNFLLREFRKEESAKKREAFLNMLSKRYPQYAERIHRPSSESGYPVQNRRPRDPHRRATTVVTYNPGCEQDFDNRSDTMSSSEGPTLRRGGWMRNSMPVMKSPPNMYDKMAGVVFLVVGDQTKKAELPNEITHLDTVRALFVRSFPKKLTMEYLASPKQKIYILDTMTNIYYQLEDLQDIKNRTVLRLYNSDSEDPQQVREPPPEVRGKQMQVSREPTPPRIPEQGRRSQTLPTGMTHSYPPYQENQVPHGTKSTDRSRSLPRGQGPDYGYITYHSTDRMQNSVDGHHYPSTSPDRPNLRPIPEHRHYLNGHSHGHEIRRSPPTNRSRSADPYYRDLSPPAHAITAPGAPPQTYIATGVRANTMVSPLRATGPSGQDSRNLNRHTLAFTPMGEPTNGTMRSQSYRVPSDSSQHIPQRPRSVTPQPYPQEEVNQFRMDKMEEQIASLAAWVQTAVSSTSRTTSVHSSHTTTPSEQPSSATSSLSDISGVTQKAVTKNLKDGILTIKKQASHLKGDLRQIRRLHQLNKESLQESIHDTMKKIATALRSVPGAEHQLLRQHRVEADTTTQKYLEKKCQASKELSDLEGAVEELREDVISRQCHVNMSDVEGMALMLSTVTKTFGELKAAFPEMQKDLKKVMAGEMEIVVTEEKFLKEEPEAIEEALKRCKRLTGTLFTLKRLASVQEHRAPQVPTKRVGGKIPSEEDKKALLENIRAMVPDHQTRVLKLEAADASRQRKKNIITQQEALKFGKSLEIATRLLRPSNKESVSSADDGVTKSSASEQVPAGQSSSSATSVSVKPNTVLSSIPSSAITATSISPSESTAVKSDRSPSSREVSEKQSEEFVNQEDDPCLQAALLAKKKDIARAAFFSSMTTPPTSPSPSDELKSFSPPRPLMDYTVHISQVKDSSTGETQYTVTDGRFSQASHSSATAQLVTSTTTATPTGSNAISLASTRLSPTNIPRISSIVKSTETVESSKITRKIRTSTPIASKDSEKTVSKIPSLRKDGQSESSSGPDVRPKKIPPPPPPRKSSRLPSPGVKMDTEVSQNGSVSIVSSKPKIPPKDITILGGHQMQVKDSGIGTSTPKSSILPKPSSKFEKGIIEAIAVQNKESFKDSGTKLESHEQTLSEQEAQGARAKMPPPGKKPKPPPPQRKSSLSHSEEKSQTLKTKEDL
ncbi:coiled-coil domain-containing protein AGAP005037-like isoform X2 [Saccostrea echinata]|uniref:coiled-coil domain-containing protein AGAP005037-like isoform X2 n=1 Tax=Saccostrea echinata TaxID=191078 RepID=UPI002A803D52|nr:coiled-coil domain-containing protein AGAP005037-like isoform X2 [Saccostrea echinata]